MEKSNLPTPHGDKLKALLSNVKLPAEDRNQVQNAIGKYTQWLSDLYAVRGDAAHIVAAMVSLLNDYKTAIELDLIFDSQQDFLYRQKGQLKLDNTILEEFLPILVTSALATQLPSNGLCVGPTTCFSSLHFESSLVNPAAGGGMRIREKDHDFVLGRRLFIQTSYHPDLHDSAIAETHVAYIAAECKTNLDKTMFQEAAATALDIKTAVPGAKYYLLCEWLDMTPIHTSTTAIDEILILRRTKRISSEIRSHFNTAAGRRQYRILFADYLKTHPFVSAMFQRFLDHIQRNLGIATETDILTRGYF